MVTWVDRSAPALSAANLNALAYGIGNAVSPRTYGAVGDGVTDDYAAFVSMLAAMSAGDVADLGGDTFLLGTTWNVTKAIEIRNGTLTATGRRVLLVNAAGMVCRDVTFIRTGLSVGSDDGSAVFAQAEDYFSLDCIYDSYSRQPLRMGHGLADGAHILRGYCYPRVAFEDCAGIYVNAGATGNTDITIDGVTVVGNGSSTNGILIFDASDCTVRNCVVDTATMLPNITHTSGWSNVSGNIYRKTDRTDGTTRAVWIAATEYTEQTATPATPGSNEWGVSGGFLYINLGGTDPNTQSIVSRIVSGYGITFYSSTNGYDNMSRNRIEHCRISNTDGFGIYWQLGDFAAANNGTNSNILTDVCLKGVQSGKLPFAGIGIIAGSQTSLMNDMLDGVGSVATPAHGLRINPEVATRLSSGIVVGMQVTHAKSAGITLGSGRWNFVACRAIDNTSSGFQAFWNLSTDVVEADLISCTASGNGVHGVDIDASVVAGANYQGNVTGGRFHSNGSRNIEFKGVRSSKIIGVTCYAPAVGQYNIVVEECIHPVIVDDVTIYSGNGISVDATSAPTTMVGKFTSDVTSTNQLLIGAPVLVDGSTYGVAEWLGSGSPEGVVSAVVGSTYHRTNGGAGTSVYVKESGSGNTGWVGK